MSYPRLSMARVAGVLLAVLPFVLRWPARADSDVPRVVEAGPEDGISCCTEPPFLFDRDEVLVATGRAGYFRSEDRGEGWQRSMAGLVAANGVSPFLISHCQAPSEPRIVYALVGLGTSVTPFSGLFSSADFGKTWTRRAPLAFAPLAARCTVDALDPRTVYINVLDPNFESHSWRSADGGRTVQLADSSLPACAVGGGVTSVPDALYVFNGLVPDCLFVSTDGGASFRSLSPPSGLMHGFAVRPDGSTIILGTRDENFNHTGTFRSTDGGRSFVPVSGLPNGGHVAFDIAFDPTDTSRIYARDLQLNVSTDGGLSFKPVPPPDDPRFLGPVGVIGVDARGALYLDTRGGPFRSDDGGLTFRSLLPGFRAPSVADLAFDAEGLLLVGVQHTRVVYRQVQGRTFRPIGTSLNDATSLSTDAASVAGSPADPNVVLAATVGQGLLRTEDGGRNWTSATVPGDPRFYQDSRMAFVTASRVYVVAPRVTPGLYRSDDAGQSFARLSSLPLGAIAVDPAQPDVLYVGTYGSDGGLFKSTDGGLTLEDLGRPGVFSALAVDRRDPNVIYAGERFGQVIRSLDGGQTFTVASLGLGGAGVHGLAQDAEGTLFVWLRGGGLFASEDDAVTWRPVDTGEALRRSGVEAGRGSLAIDPGHPGRVYLGNAGLIRIDAGHDVAGEGTSRSSAGFLLPDDPRLDAE
jgi:photosystem II stability/assembly factor-like uncharacterized protein